MMYFVDWFHGIKLEGKGGRVARKVADIAVDMCSWVPIPTSGFCWLSFWEVVVVEEVYDFCNPNIR